jgi:hypothetical protein
MSKNLVCFWLFSPVYSKYIREEVLLKWEMGHSAKSLEAFNACKD